MSKKKESKERPTWYGYYTRKTKTKKEKIKSLERKHKKNFEY